MLFVSDPIGHADVSISCSHLASTMSFVVEVAALILGVIGVNVNKEAIFPFFFIIFIDFFSVSIGIGILSLSKLIVINPSPFITVTIWHN